MKILKQQLEARTTIIILKKNYNLIFINFFMFIHSFIILLLLRLLLIHISYMCSWNYYNILT